MKRTPLKRTKPIKKRNAKRRKRLGAEQFGPDGFCDFVRDFGCVIARERGGPQDCGGVVEVAHVISRGAGGGWRSNCLGLCASHHRQQHDLGIKTFEKRNETDLAYWARRITGHWDAPQPKDAA